MLGVALIRVYIFAVGSVAASNRGGDRERERQREGGWEGQRGGRESGGRE